LKVAELIDQVKKNQMSAVLNKKSILHIADEKLLQTNSSDLINLNNNEI